MVFKTKNSLETFYLECLWKSNKLKNHKDGVKMLVVIPISALFILIVLYAILKNLVGKEKTKGIFLEISIITLKIILGIIIGLIIVFILFILYGLIAGKFRYRMY